MPKPLISVIIPVYNSEKYLNACLESVTGQSYTELEILLIDDGSMDSSPALCDAWEKKDSRVRVFHKKNGGQADARNLGFKMSHGEYIGYVDSDDTVEPCMYEMLLSALEENSLDMAVCARFNVNEKNGEKQELFALPSQEIWEKREFLSRFLTWRNLDGSPCDKLFARHLLEGNEFPLGLICEDIPFVYNALKKCEKIVHIAKPLYNYLQREGSTSHSKFSEKTFGLVKYPCEIREDVLKIYPELSEEVDYFYYSRILNFLNMLSPREQKEIFLKYTKIIRENKKAILKSQIFNKRQKTLTRLISLRLYVAVRRVYNILKGRKL